MLNWPGGLSPSLLMGLKPAPYTANLGLGPQFMTPQCYSRPFIDPGSQPFLFSFAQDESKDFVSSSRRKQYGSSEYLLQADTSGRRIATKVELQDPESNSPAPPGLQGEEQVCEGR